MNLRTAIEDYLAVLVPSEIEEAARINELIVRLDVLALASHEVKFKFDEQDYADPPRRDNKALREVVAKLFPTLGHYSVALDVSEKTEKSTLSVGDAVDDIADIAVDLNEVLWRLENTSEDDALFYFQLLFRNHWGLHLRRLQLYLHDISYHRA